MKKFILLTIVIVLLFSCCATKQISPKERNESFIADINAFDIDSFHLYASSSNIGKIKITDFNVSFAPRSNYLMVTGRVGVNAVRIAFSYEERKSLLEAKKAYIDAYEQNTIPDEKPTKKNKYSQGTVSVEWGVAGFAHDVETTYITNAQYLEKDKPYFRILFNQTESEADKVYSPKISIYISPSQWEKIIEACNQEHLVELTDKILEEANAF